MNDPTPWSAEESRIQDYLAGRLDEAAAERFEQRMFEDDALAAEVESALESNAATLQAATRSRAVRRDAHVRRRRAWRQSAAAPDCTATWPVPRGIEQRMGLTVG